MIRYLFEDAAIMQSHFIITLISLIIKNMLKKNMNNKNSLTINGKNTH